MFIVYLILEWEDIRVLAPNAEVTMKNIKIKFVKCISEDVITYESLY